MTTSAMTIVNIDAVFRKKIDVAFDAFVAEVLTANNRTTELTQNEWAFLRNRFKEGKKAYQVAI